MVVKAVIVGLNEWEKFTLPMLNSAKKNDPELKLYLVDNGSAQPYPQVSGVNLIRNKQKDSYAVGLNLGIKSAGEADWYMLINNDTLIDKPITKRIEKLDPNALYGFFIRESRDDLFPWSYLSSWCYFLSRQVWEKIGAFDENCRPLYFEDADYTMRCMKEGIRITLLSREDWGIQHLEDAKHPERKDGFKARPELRKYILAKHGF